MRTVVAHHLLSLDGVAEAPETFVECWDEVMDANWPTSDLEPFATFIDRVQIVRRDTHAAGRALERRDAHRRLSRLGPCCASPSTLPLGGYFRSCPTLRGIPTRMLS